MVSDPTAALAWVVGLLATKAIPFQAVGGLAARAYGATRPLVDLDFYIPMSRWPELLPDVEPYVTWGPEHYRDQHWDLTFVKLEYQGQKIEFGDSSEASFFDPQERRWIRQVIDYSGSVWREVLGVRVPVMPKEELVAYKRRLDRDVDRMDLAEIASVPRAPNESAAGDSRPGIFPPQS